MGGIVGGGTYGQILYVGAGNLLAGTNPLSWNGVDSLLEFDSSASIQNASVANTSPGTGSTIWRCDINTQALDTSDFVMNIGNAGNNGVTARNDWVMTFGYNAAASGATYKERSGDHAYFFQFESFYHPSAEQSLTESHLVYVSPSSAFYSRPSSFVTDVALDFTIGIFELNTLYLRKPNGSLTGADYVTAFPGAFTITQEAQATTGLVAFKLIGGAHTTLTASTEQRDMFIDLSAQMEFATGALAVERSIYIEPRTYKFVGASTITTAATFAIGGAPAAGTNATITSSLALWVQAGTSRFGGTVQLANASFLQWEDSGATLRNVLTLYSDNHIYFDNNAGGSLILRTGATQNRIVINSSGVVNVTGELDLDGALNHDGSTVGFYGTTPTAQQTGVAVTATAVHNALVNLGLITA
jgi:hypothetical protein